MMVVFTFRGLYLKKSPGHLSVFFAKNNLFGTKNENNKKNLRYLPFLIRTYLSPPCTTMLAEIEACLNSRPLCPVSNDPDVLSILTPAHFLIGDNLLVPPRPSLLDINIS